jgi:L-iditol 2-dehydrogenase
MVLVGDRRTGTMRAAILTAPDRIETTSVPEPVVTDGDVLVRVRTVGVCGTDVKIASGRIHVQHPRILGHEMVGQVLADGDPIADGQTVLVDPAIACGVCRQCREGRSNICTAGALIGRDRDGGLAELVSVPRANIHRLPLGIDAGEAPLLQVLATCVHAQRLVSVFPGDAVAVIGLGVTGLLHLQLAKGRGARPLVGSSRSHAGRSTASALGADAVIDATGDPVPALRESAPDGFDLVIDCVGSVRTLAQAVALARVGGRILAYGTVTSHEGEFPWYELYYKELVVSHPRSANAEDFPAAIALVAGRFVDIARLVTHRFALTDTDSALATASASGVLKVLVDV